MSNRTAAAHRRFARLRALFAAVVVLTVFAAGALPAHATSDEDHNWWYTGMHVEDARNEGLTGAGVKIAVIDGQINPDLELFAGASLAIDPVVSCDVPVVSQELSEGAIHGTAVTALLVARPVGGLPMQGIAPDAAVTFYSTGGSCTGPIDRPSPMMAAVARAVADGNRIVSVSSAQGLQSDADVEVIAQALAAGVVIVAATPNKDDQRFLVAPHEYNGVVSVAAVSRDGMLQSNDNGTPVITPSVTVVAPGINVQTPANENGWGHMNASGGTSYATPLVAGALALLLQKYPTATGNQLIQALISTTSQSREGQPRNDTNGGGYGAISLPYLLAADPTTLPDENPLMNKPLGVPTAEQIGGRGVVSTPTATATATPKATASAPASPSTPTRTTSAPATSTTASEATATSAMPILIVIGAVAILLAVVLVVVLVLRSARRSRS